METKKTNERKVFLGLVEMNKSQKNETTGGSVVETSKQMQPCCGLVMTANPLSNPLDFLNIF